MPASKPSTLRRTRAAAGAPVSPAQMAHAVRVLAMDAVEKAGCGHPGLPMGAADIATVLFTRFLRFDPRSPDWPDRDRFVLSAGHGSMLLYALLYLLGFEGMTDKEIKAFRQLGSKTPGHPEYGHTPGVEATTGPLGQGLGMALGMALGERILQARFGADIVDHYTYVLASDGDLMEGISHETISLAGHLGLGKLILLHDDNRVTIDGALSLAESGDMGMRFEAAGWETRSVDGHDADALAEAIEAARQSDKPSYIACRTEIGHGAPNKAGDAASHGAPLGAEEVAGARKAYAWKWKAFEVPAPVLDAWRLAGLRGAKGRKAWERRREGLDEATRTKYTRALKGDTPDHVYRVLGNLKKRFSKERDAMPTRKASGTVLSEISEHLPELVGGSADLTGSNNAKPSERGVITADDFSGGYIHYGIREHAMAAATNGLALHGGIIPYGATFLVFSDYCRPAIRLSALMGVRAIYVMTHDSIGLGEDGPTHQPIEHLAGLRAIPNLYVFRPADAVETVECWEMALRAKKCPSILVLSRQSLPLLRTTHRDDNPCAKGAYEIAPIDGQADATLLATGSEVAIALKAQKILENDGLAVRVVSMPCVELFEEQDAAYQERVLGRTRVRVACEAACGQGWGRYTGTEGAFVGMTRFGASAPAADLFAHFNITPEALATRTRNCLETRAAPDKTAESTEATPKKTKKTKKKGRA